MTMIYILKCLTEFWEIRILRNYMAVRLSNIPALHKLLSIIIFLNLSDQITSYSLLPVNIPHVNDLLINKVLWRAVVEMNLLRTMHSRVPCRNHKDYQVWERHRKLLLLKLSFGYTDKLWVWTVFTAKNKKYCTCTGRAKGMVWWAPWRRTLQLCSILYNFVEQITRWCMDWWKLISFYSWSWVSSPLWSHDLTLLPQVDNEATTSWQEA